jgi:hypothetical protein
MPCPPEVEPDPSRPVAAAGTTGRKGPTQLSWQYVRPGQFGRVELGPLFNNAQHVSGYALTYIGSPEERSATLLVGGGEAVRIWLNGRLIHENPHAPGWEWGLDRVPVTLRPGRNTLLAKPTRSTKWHLLILRIADSPMDRGITLAERGLWEEAGPLLAQGYGHEESYWEAIWRFYFQAILARATGRVSVYRRLCDQMVDRFGMTPGYFAASLLARTCGLAPEGTREPAALIRLAKVPLATNPSEAEFQFTLGLAYYRAARFEQAIGRLSEPTALNRWPPAWPVLAMVRCFGRRGRDTTAIA